VEHMVFAMSLIQAQNREFRSPSDAARDEEAFYAQPRHNLKAVAGVAAMVGAIAAYAGLIGMVGR
jgi:predicted hotdog family 3-hydroxylacyl-ACP dehydratase